MPSNFEPDILEQLRSLPQLSGLHKSCYNIDKGHLNFHLPIEHIQEDIRNLLLQTTSIQHVNQQIPIFKALKAPHPQIKNIIGIASGKGGVGKSTITYFLAQALQHMGAKCGVLDADIYGPSQALMFDINEKPSIKDKYFLPFYRNGIQVMSIGVLAGSSKALMWRGPMISQALMQMYQQTLWSDLDYLLIDLPPGTGDISLTLLQKIPLTASVLVSNPHPLAEIDVKRCGDLFKQLNAPVLTTIMNMADSTSDYQNNSIHTLPSIEYQTKFREISPIIHPEFVHLAQSLTQLLCFFPTHITNPFDQIKVTPSS